MGERVIQRLCDIVESIDQIDSLLAGITYSDFLKDRHKRAAFERYLEVVSEASRHVPEKLKSNASEIPWRNIADIGNHIRHAYNRIDPEILWKTYESGKLVELKSVCLNYLGELKPPSEPNSAR